MLSEYENIGVLRMIDATRMAFRYYPRLGYGI
jgi:hypothetical protein